MEQVVFGELTNLDRSAKQSLKKSQAKSAKASQVKTPAKPVEEILPRESEQKENVVVEIVIENTTVEKEIIEVPVTIEETQKEEIIVVETTETVVETITIEEEAPKEIEAKPEETKPEEKEEFLGKRSAAKREEEGTEAEKQTEENVEPKVVKKIKSVIKYTADDDKENRAD